MSTDAKEMIWAVADKLYEEGGCDKFPIVSTIREETGLASQTVTLPPN